MDDSEGIIQSNDQFIKYTEWPKNINTTTSKMYIKKKRTGLQQI